MKIDYYDLLDKEVKITLDTEDAFKRVLNGKIVFVGDSSLRLEDKSKKSVLVIPIINILFVEYFVKE